MEILGDKPNKEIINGIEKWSYSRDMKDIIVRKVQKIKVLARCLPEHKFALIVALQTAGSSVAVTADGLNDVDALKQANVGFCMGQSGCEIAKDASDIIFLDDNFNSVFKATIWGRNIIDNIRKFLQFQLAINIVCVAIVFLGGATLGNSPFSVIQLLWINMIMDTFAAIGIATEPPSTDEADMNLEERRRKEDKIIQPGMWRNILIQTVYQFIILVVMLYSVPWWFNIGYDLVDEDFYA
jgi:magnesium-transporting ATPase (P-type)